MKYKWYDYIIPVICIIIATSAGYGIGHKDFRNEQIINEEKIIINKSPHFNKAIPELIENDTIIIKFGYDAHKAIVLGNFQKQEQIYLRVIIRNSYVDRLFKYSDNSLFMYKRR